MIQRLKKFSRAAIWASIALVFLLLRQFLWEGRWWDVLYVLVSYVIVGAGFILASVLSAAWKKRKAAKI